MNSTTEAAPLPPEDESGYEPDYEVSEQAAAFRDRFETIGPDGQPSRVRLETLERLKHDPGMVGESARLRLKRTREFAERQGGSGVIKEDMSNLHSGGSQPEESVASSRPEAAVVSVGIIKGQRHGAPMVPSPSVSADGPGLPSHSQPPGAMSDSTAATAPDGEGARAVALTGALPAFPPMEGDVAALKRIPLGRSETHSPTPPVRPRARPYCLQCDAWQADSCGGLSGHDWLNVVACEVCEGEPRQCRACKE